MTSCTCPANPRTARDFSDILACPETDPADIPMLARTAARLRLREAQRDPRSIVFDSAFVCDDAIRDLHRRAFLVCECPICDDGEGRDEIDYSDEDGINPEVCQ